MYLNYGNTLRMWKVVCQLVTYSTYSLKYIGTDNVRPIPILPDLAPKMRPQMGHSVGAGKNSNMGSDAVMQWQPILFLKI